MIKGLKINDTYTVIKVPKNGCSTVAIQTLIYNEPHKFNIIYFKDCEYKHLNGIGRGLIFPLTYNFFVNCDDIKNKPNEKLCFIFRDPYERFLSAYKTDFIGKNKTIIEFIDFVKNEINTNKHNLKIVDEHYRPQHTFLNFEDVDVFIELKDYEKFCNENNILFIKANQNFNKNYKNEITLNLTKEHINDIKELYKEDYIMIDKIKNSNKLYGTL